MRLNNKSGVSPVIATLLLMVITVVAFGIAYGAYSSWIATQRNSALPEMQERISIEAAIFNSENNVTLVIRNIGASQVTIDRVFINEISSTITSSNLTFHPSEDIRLNLIYPAEFVKNQVYTFNIYSTRGTSSSAGFSYSGIHYVAVISTYTGPTTYTSTIATSTSTITSENIPTTQYITTTGETTITSTHGTTITYTTTSGTTTQTLTSTSGTSTETITSTQTIPTTTITQIDTTSTEIVEYPTTSTVTTVVPVDVVMTKTLTSQMPTTSVVTQTLTSTTTMQPEVTFVSAGAGLAEKTGTLTPSYPPNLQNNDLILLQVTLTSNNKIVTVPSQFTLLYGPDSIGNNNQWIYYKFSDGTETGTISVSTNGNEYIMARMYAFRNVATTNFYESGSSGSGSSNTIYAQSVIITDQNAMPVSFVYVAGANNLGSFTGETGGDWEEQVAEFISTSGDGSGCLQLQTASMLSVGTISGGSYTMAQSDPWIIRAFALKPKAPITSTITNTVTNTTTLSTTTSTSSTVTSSTASTTNSLSSQITFTTNDLPSINGVVFTIDGVNYYSYNLPRVFNWAIGSSHSVIAHTPLNAYNGRVYGFNDWTNGYGLVADVGTFVTPAVDTTVVANYVHEKVYVIFEVEGLPVSFNGPVLSVDGVNMTQWELLKPDRFFWNVGSQHSIIAYTPLLDVWAAPPYPYYYFQGWTNGNWLVGTEGTFVTPGVDATAIVHYGTTSTTISSSTTSGVASTITTTSRSTVTSTFPTTMTSTSTAYSTISSLSTLTTSTATTPIVTLTSTSGTGTITTTIISETNTITTTSSTGTRVTVTSYTTTTSTITSTKITYTSTMQTTTTNTIPSTTITTTTSRLTTR